MLYRLFKRKPIFVVTLTSLPTKEDYDGIKNNLKEELGDDYKIVIIFDPHKTYMETKLLK